MNYNIVKHIGTLSDGKITTELNVIEWNGRKAQYDLRRWSVDETGERTPLKGLCFLRLLHLYVGIVGFISRFLAAARVSGDRKTAHEDQGGAKCGQCPQ